MGWMYTYYILIHHNTINYTRNTRIIYPDLPVSYRSYRPTS